MTSANDALLFYLSGIFRQFNGMTFSAVPCLITLSSLIQAIHDIIRVLVVELRDDLVLDLHSAWR